MVTERSLSDSEVKALHSEFGQIKKRKTANIRFLTIWMIFALLAGIIFYANFRTIGMKYLATGIVLVYTLIGILMFFENLLKQKRQKRIIHQILSDNHVTSIEIEPLSYIELEQAAKEGTHYLFQLCDNKILSMGGKDFSPTEVFPCTRFEVIFHYNQKGIITILQKYAYGMKMKPERIISGKTKLEWMKRPNYPDSEIFTIIEGNLSDFEDTLS